MLRGISASIIAAVIVASAHLAYGRGFGWNVSLASALVLGCDIVFLLSPVVIVIGAVLGHLAKTTKEGAATGMAAGLVVGFVLTVLDGFSAIALVGGSATFALTGAVLGRLRTWPAAN
jgi:hypothetical protein